MLRAASRRLISTEPRLTGVSGLLSADKATWSQSVYHASSKALILAPLPFLVSAAHTPVDYLLTLALPVHSHIGLNVIVTDYVPRPLQRSARLAVLATSVTIFVGLATLLEQGSGLTQVVKRLWSPTPAKKDDAAGK
jgi:succinate dehydrogenase (ubiquinone) membrane anchor subunit